MPLLQPYQGDLEQYNPNPRSDFDLSQLVNTWLQSRAIKENRMKQERDKQIFNAIINTKQGEDINIPERAQAPQGFLGKLGEFMTGGRPQQGISSLEQAMAEEAIKNRFISPTDALINQGKVADAQMKIYEAGGPKPSLFNQPSVQPGLPPQLPQQPLLLQNAPQGIQDQMSMKQPQISLETDINFPTSIEYDEFGRPLKTKSDILDRQKFNIEQKEKAEAKRKESQMVKDSAQVTLDTISEIKKGIKYFGAAGKIPPLWAEYSKNNWKANLDRLKGRLVLDLMNAMKQASKTGATGFGQLSEKELKILQDSATVLKADLSEEDALKYLNQLKNVASKVIKEGNSTMNISPKPSNAAFYSPSTGKYYDNKGNEL